MGIASKWIGIVVVVVGWALPTNILRLKSILAAAKIYLWAMPTLLFKY
jgi:hypothetical protein